jgi:cytochrome d ubiquinol oxidase subunit I
MGAFGIIGANAWMNTPQGFNLDSQGRPTDVDVRSAVFTPMFGPQYWHFVVAMFLTAGYVVAGVYAVGRLRGRRDRYHRLGFCVPFTVAAILTPVQFFLGDNIARQVYQKQPVKFAAAELVWKTGSHVPEYLFGRLQADGTVKGGIKVPQLDSILADGSPGTVVTGLTSVPAEDRPTPTQATIVHRSFDIMAGIGTALITAYVYDGLTHGLGLLLVILSAVAATAWLVAGRAAGWARFTAVGAVALVIAAWGAAQRPYLVPTSLTVQQAAGAAGPLHWLLVVTGIAIVLVGPALVVLYRLDTRGLLEAQTDADVEGGAGRPDAG